MSRTRTCPICKGSASAEVETYHSSKKNWKTNEEIIVSDVEVYLCRNSECGHRWLPADQERKIDRTVSQAVRYDLQPDEVRLIRESLKFENKFETADFLCLNEKAFTKWELGYTAPNRAYDLLLRLSARSWDNYRFIQKLHDTNFTFAASDYQLICEHTNARWDVFTGNLPGQSSSGVPVSIQVSRPSSEIKFSVVNNEETLTVSQSGYFAGDTEGAVAS